MTSFRVTSIYPHLWFLLVSHSAVSNSLQPLGLQHTMLSCPSPSFRVCPNSCPLSRWCHPTRRRQWNPTLVLLPGKSHGWRSLVSCSPWGPEESDTTERLHFHFSPSVGEGNGNPLQCSCLENPRDRGVWWAAIYGVAQSRTLLKWLSSSSIHIFQIFINLRIDIYLFVKGIVTVHEGRKEKYIFWRPLSKNWNPSVIPN